MERSDSGRIPLRVIAVQLVIIAAVVVFLKFYLPHLQKTDEASRLAARDSRIVSFYQEVTGGGETLHSTPSVQEVDQAVGAPDTSTTDYAGGLHLTWKGAQHSLTGSFFHNSLYSLTLADNATGQRETANK